MKMTVKQFAEKAGVNGITAQSFLGLAAAIGLGGITKSESLKTAKKGRPCYQYEIPDAVIAAIPVKPAVVETPAAPAAPTGEQTANAVEQTMVVAAGAEPAPVAATEPVAVGAEGSAPAGEAAV